MVSRETRVAIAVAAIRIGRCPTPIRSQGATSRHAPSSARQPRKHRPVAAM